ncbi:hypothetical protein VB618_15150 [Microvirga sp. CF3062]|uniref:hypothetical protein n=1 Tax=Microvirga sp. CF3062 TaxID=3110182 RepID=UPI002E76BE92|nr:hypothetical protein [Microvirga sp. CF3062]MEE1657544.1 hypothetical protein [Microvirga sp. CF3062]
MTLDPDRPSTLPEGSRPPGRSALRSVFLGLAIIVSALMCLGGLIVTTSGIIMIMAPPFGPMMLAAGLTLLLSGIGLLRMFMRKVSGIA